MKLSFETVFAYHEVIAKLATDGDDFAKMWVKYLQSTGWTEDEFIEEVNRGCN
jgi:hypothetical protein